MSGYGNLTSLGYQQLAVDTATALTVPDRTSLILITPQAQAARWRDDGTAPSATVGYPLSALSELRYDSKSQKALQFIGQAAGCILNITYYGKEA